jgi:PAS domain-containing protein
MSSEPYPSVVSGDVSASGLLMQGLMKSGSPCAIVDRSGAVTRANAAFEKLAPASTGRLLTGLFRFNPSTLGEGRQVGSFPSPVEVLYSSAGGALVPAWLHTLCESPDTGDRLLLVADGAPLRRAELQRLDAAPLAVMRVCADGVVRSANAATYSALSLDPKRVIGHKLLSLFNTSDENKRPDGEPDERSLKNCFSDCLTKLEPVKLEISVARLTRGERESAPLLMIPDLAPDGRALGVLAVIELTLVDRVREKIARIARAPLVESWQARLGRILEEVRRLIPFDHANFGMYADNVQFFRAFALYPRDHLKWTERWLPLPPGVKEWLEDGKTAIPDIREFVGAFPEFNESQVVRMYEDRGMRSSATLVAKDEKGPTSALSLCSHDVGKYTQRDVELLRNLDLEPVLIRIEELIHRQRHDLGVELKNDLATVKSLPEVACRIVDTLAASFHWDYVSLYRVDRQKEIFKLFHQSSCTNAFRIRPGYTQSFNDGMLGAALREKKEIVVNEVGNPRVEQYGYISLGRKAVHSAMTIPVRLNDRIRWMLHIETREAHAFHGADLRSVMDLTKLVQDGIRQRAVEEINRVVMLETRQGVVVVGMEGAILYTNKAARRLLGMQDERPKHKFLSDYASENDPFSARVLSGSLSMGRRRVKVARGHLGTGRRLTGSRHAFLSDHAWQDDAGPAEGPGGSGSTQRLRVKAAGRGRGLQEKQPRHKFLSDYASKDDPRSAEILNGLGSTERRRVELLGEDKQIRPVLATRRMLDGSFDTAIWFLIDIQARTWEVDMRFLRETVADVAQQTRAPLALAGNLARQLSRLCESGQPVEGAAQEPATDRAEKLSTRLLAEIGKADITFERLAEGLEIRRYPVRTMAPLDFGRCVAREVSLLPARDQDLIDMVQDQRDHPVNGDAERLEFVVRSLLAHLIRVRSDEGRVSVSLSSGNGKVVLSFTLSDAMPAAPAESRTRRVHDIMWRAVRIAREDASLALEAVRLVIEKHDGSLETGATSEGDDYAVLPWAGFRITLPEWKGGRP